MINEYDLVIDCEPYLNISALLAWWTSRKRIGFNHGVRSLMYTHKTEFDDTKHEVHAYMDLGRIAGTDYVPEALERLQWGNYAENRIEEILKEQVKRGQKMIGICATTAESAPHRAWPPERFSELCNKLIKKHNAKIIFMGTKTDEELYANIEEKIDRKENVLNLTGRTNLKEAFCITAKCHLFISNDTGPMHIAAAQGVKTIGLFGPNLPLRFGPFGKGNNTLYKQMPCSPCVNVHRGSFPECTRKIKGECMHRLSSEEAYKLAKDMLKSKR